MMPSAGRILVAFTLSAAACSDDAAAPECEQNADCASGEICDAGTCVRLCEQDRYCEAGQICDDGLCVHGERVGLPQISAIDGNGSESKVFADALVLLGARLEGASARLTGGSIDADLEVRQNTGERMEVALPLDLVEGAYTLEVANAVGPTQAGVELLRGEPQDGPGVLALLQGLGDPVPGLNADQVDGQDASDFVSSNPPAAMGEGTTDADATLTVGGNLSVALTGVVTVGGGSTDVVGTGTQFESEFPFGPGTYGVWGGATIEIEGNRYTVADVVDDTHLTLATPAVAGAADATAYTDADLFAVNTGNGDRALSVDKSGWVHFGSRGFVWDPDLGQIFVDSLPSAAVGTALTRLAIDGSGGSEPSEAHLYFRRAVGRIYTVGRELTISATSFDSPDIRLQSGNVTLPGLAGPGNGYVCVDANGTLYRSATACN